jgi:hypothetical protein
MIKLLYLEKRKPGFTRDQFIKRWRKHGALGMSTDFWRHALVYVQAEPISPAPLPGASDDYDAVAYLGYGDQAFSAPFTAQDERDTEMMLKDEFETFATPTPNVSFWLEEESLKTGEPGGVTAFLFFTDTVRAREAAEHYRQNEILNRVVFNTKRTDIQLGSFEPVYPYTAIMELSATNLSGLKGVLAAAATAPWRTSDLAVIAREAVLWDRVSPA